MRHQFVMLLMLLGLATTAPAQQVSVGVGLPSVSIGINLPVYPELISVPGYPVYYAPRLNSNYFFYDGLYWVYQGDNWYSSSWYNGPWGLIGPEFVPVYVLRIPVRYYRQPPAYFRGWQRNAAPRWGEHWGHDWEQQRRGWNKRDHRATPASARLPVYQRQYSGERYPRADQQQVLHNQNYHYQSKDPMVREHYLQQKTQGTPVPSERSMPGYPQQRRSGHDAPSVQRPQSLTPPPQVGREPQSPPGQVSRRQDQGGSHEANRGHEQGQEKGRERGRESNEERHQERNR